MYNNFIVHSGIKGQKWGIRRFQNEDGTLTEEGKRRYGLTDTGTGNGNGRNKDRKKNNKPESKTWKSKDAAYLSDEELNRRNSRLQREKQYRDMTRSKSDKAKKWIATTASTILVTAAITALSNHMQNDVYKKLIKKNGPKAVKFLKSKGAAVLASHIISSASKKI